MDEKRNKNIRTVFGWFLSALIVTCGALLIGRAIALFVSGGAKQGAFTRENVGQALMQISAPLVLSVLSVIAGYVLAEVFTVGEKKRGALPARYILYRLRAHTRVEGEYAKKIAAIEYVLVVVRVLCGVVAATASVCVIAYLANPASYDKLDVNGTMLNAFIRCFPLISVAFVACAGADIWAGLKTDELTSLYKTLPATKDRREDETLLGKVERVISSKKYVLALRCVLGAIAVAFIILGALDGGVRGVLQKAINICTECIGLG